MGAMYTRVDSHNKASNCSMQIDCWKWVIPAAAVTSCMSFVDTVNTSVRVQTWGYKLHPNFHKLGFCGGLLQVEKLRKRRLCPIKIGQVKSARIPFQKFELKGVKVGHYGMKSYKLETYKLTDYVAVIPSSTMSYIIHKYKSCRPTQGAVSSRSLRISRRRTRSQHWYLPHLHSDTLAISTKRTDVINYTFSMTLSLTFCIDKALTDPYIPSRCWPPLHGKSSCRSWERRFAHFRHPSTTWLVESLCFRRN